MNKKSLVLSIASLAAACADMDSAGLYEDELAVKSGSEDGHPEELAFEQQARPRLGRPGVVPVRNRQITDQEKAIARKLATISQDLQEKYFSYPIEPVRLEGGAVMHRYRGWRGEGAILALKTYPALGTRVQSASGFLTTYYVFGGMLERWDSLGRSAWALPIEDPEHSPDGQVWRQEFEADYGLEPDQWAEACNFPGRVNSMSEISYRWLTSHDYAITARETFAPGWIDCGDPSNPSPVPLPCELDPVWSLIDGSENYVERCYDPARPPRELQGDPFNPRDKV